MKREDIKLGIYEKALPYGISWKERLAIAEKLGFHYVEISVDETDERLSRLDWTTDERNQFSIAVVNSPLSVPTMCLSGHRRYPLGSHDPDVRKEALNIMEKAIYFCVDTGVRTIQLAGYDVYYEQGDADTRKWYMEGMQRSLEMAASEQVMLAMEVMDSPFMNSILKFMNMKDILKSPWFTVYPDVGNLSAWGNDVAEELTLGIHQVVSLHLKETLAVTPDHGGTFKEVPFGTGCVDFSMIFAKLKELSYRGPFLIEMWTEKAEDPEKEILDAREWIFQRMNEGGYIDD